MFRIRFHGRGGQGIKTASRILGTAFFLAGYEVQDAPRYGAERRGAPMFGYIRADHSPILERGVINRPDLVVIVDETLLRLPTAGVFSGLTPQTIFLVLTEKKTEEMEAQLPIALSFLILEKRLFSQFHTTFPMDSCVCSAAAACLAGLPLGIFQQAMLKELHVDDPKIHEDELFIIEKIYNQVDTETTKMQETDATSEKLEEDVQWIDLEFEDARLSAPAIHGGATSQQMKTGDWRTMRPVMDHEVCNRCRLCYTYCPDGVISLDDNGYPVIDYNHCKGCLICLVQCPCDAIVAVAEHDKEVVDA